MQITCQMRLGEDRVRERRELGVRLKGGVRLWGRVVVGGQLPAIRYGYVVALTTEDLSQNPLVYYSMKIQNEELILKEGVYVEKATVADEAGNSFSRYRVNRPDVAAVLVFNTETQRIVLTKQFRYAVRGKQEEDIVEIVAGRLDDGETPEEGAVRETEEEIGYRVKKENLTLLVNCFATPGYSSERLNIFYATVTNADKINAGGGLEDEHEQIELVELTVQEFRQMVEEGKLEDAKTYIAGLYVLFYRTNFLRSQ